MVRQEWKRLLHNPILMIVLFAIILIPSIYAGLFLASMWDPYGDIDKLPVAVVNLDDPVEFNGSELTVGDDLVTNLKEDASLDFRFVSAEDAEQGLRDGTYYMVVTIPENFSHNASTVLDPQPEKMELLYETNPATNYVAMKLSESAMNNIEKSLQEKVTETYTESLLSTLDDISGNLRDAADGTSLLIDGENDLSDGVCELANGTGDLTEGVSQLSDGSTQLYEGAEELNSGLNAYMSAACDIDDGAGQLSSGAASLYQGTTTLASGASDLSSGTSQLVTGAGTLVTGANDLSTGADALAAGTGALKVGASNLSTGAATLSTGAGTLSTGATNLSTGLNTLNSSMPAFTTGLTAYTQGVDNAATGSASLSTGLDQLETAVCGEGGLGDSSEAFNDSLSSLAAYASALSEAGAVPAEFSENLTALSQAYTAIDSGINGEGGLCDSITSAADGASALNTGLTTLSGQSDTITGGATSISTAISTAATGATSVATGAASVASGASDLATGAATLSTGVTNVDTGASTLATGASTLATGVSTLNTGITTVNTGAAALSAGVSTLNTGALDLSRGAGALSSGADQLISNNDQILSGSSSLVSGAGDLNDGTSQLYDGAIALNDGASQLSDAMPDLIDGTTDLYDGLENGAIDLDSTNKDTVNAQMISNPVDTRETKLTNVNDNGHAMAAYMMSVGLWVACLAFCLMYPLTEHEGVTSGIRWWLSKASVIYPMALLQAVVLVLILHVTLGFEPARLLQTILVACLTSLAFMSIMYYFNVLLGKIGSFIMLIFMVLQLAGSAGTYPIELSGPLAQALNRFMPFTYTVAAFRSSIGGGEPFPVSIRVLLGIFLVSTVLTVLLFVIRGKEEQKGKANLYEVMEGHGLA